MSNKDKFDKDIYNDIFKDLDLVQERKDLGLFLKSEEYRSVPFKDRLEVINTQPIFMKIVNECNNQMGTDFKSLTDIWDVLIEEDTVPQFDNFAECKSEEK